jgi:carbon-monoxide dehydrogenase large subunit
MGHLLFRCCAKITDRSREVAAFLFDTEPDAIEFAAGRFGVAGQHRTYSVFDIAALLRDGSLPTQMRGPLAATDEINARIPAHPTGCAICELEVDPETGALDIQRYTSVDDAGKAINPLIVDGQVHGGIAQGIGQSLFEEVAFDSDSGQVIGASFMDYGMPRADALPRFNVELAEDPTTNSGNPLRIKGGGEGGITPATAAVINALVDALRPYGVEHVDMPATPARVWSLIQSSRRCPDDEG